jgi:hypothetical protein
MAVVAFNGEVDDDFLTVAIDRTSRLASHSSATAAHRRKGAVVKRRIDSSRA